MKFLRAQRSLTYLGMGHAGVGHNNFEFIVSFDSYCVSDAPE